MILVILVWIFVVSGRIRVSFTVPVQVRISLRLCVLFHR